MKDTKEENYEEELQEIQEQEMYNEYQNKKFTKQILEECYAEKKPFNKWFDFEE